MSIGNLKDTGNQGNNLPYQWKVLQGLQAILDEVSLPLTCVEDSISICDADGNALDINANGSINSVIQNASGTSVTTTTVGTDVGLDVNIINSLPLEVNLDPDNDSVGIYGYTNPANPATFTGIKVDANGELQVDVLTMPATFVEDTAHVSGDIGAFVLGVRNDSNTDMTSANGDYSPIAVNSAGAVAVQDGGGSLTVDGTVSLSAGTLSALESITVQNGAGASAVNIQDGGNSITVDGGTGVQRTPTFLRPAGTDGTIALGTFSMSFASVGTANATVGGITLKPGETLNFDAGAINNTLGAVSYITSANAGAELIIITLT